MLLSADRAQRCLETKQWRSQAASESLEVACWESSGGLFKASVLINTSCGALASAPPPPGGPEQTGPEFNDVSHSVPSLVSQSSTLLGKIAHVRDGGRHSDVSATLKLHTDKDERAVKVSVLKPKIRPLPGSLDASDTPNAYKEACARGASVSLIRQMVPYPSLGRWHVNVYHWNY